ncbi:MAG: aminotransferase class V-fold PLP-dependent enzyme [Alphaproteobacteria bacterium]|nr:aminotransferase class V-fold PLP-dependent enzyme [Alphaproteobacteria bacterium]
MATPVYLDWNASAPLAESAGAAMTRAFATAGNPSSVHAAGRAARKIVEDARAAIAQAAGAADARVVFTGGGTEANALALNGFAPAECLVSAIEHDSVWNPLSGAGVIPVTPECVVDLSEFQRLLDARKPRLVAVMLANNETGAIQPVAEIARLAHGAGARVHCDAVQAFGRMPVDFAGLGVDTMALSAHKIGGPQGVGALVARKAAVLAPVFAGGQEQGIRAGTHNVAGIAGFAAAVRSAVPMSPELRDMLENALRKAHIGCVVHGAKAPRLPNTSCIGLPGVTAETQVMALDLAGFAVSAGAACSSGKVKESRVLAAMGAGKGAGEAIRVSLGPATTAAEIEAFARAWAALAGRLAPVSAAA